MPPGRILAYYRFATKFLALHERIETETPLRPKVKEIDHLLLGLASAPDPEPTAG